jgi:hypothetical protein
VERHTVRKNKSMEQIEQGRKNIWNRQKEYTEQAERTYIKQQGIDRTGWKELKEQSTEQTETNGSAESR